MGEFEMMSLDEYYDLMNEDETKRHKNPCCENCKCYYEEYGTSFCTKHDYPLEDESGNFKKCEDWR